MIEQAKAGSQLLVGLASTVGVSSDEDDDSRPASHASGDGVGSTRSAPGTKRNRPKQARPASVRVDQKDGEDADMIAAGAELAEAERAAKRFRFQQLSKAARAAEDKKMLSKEEKVSGEFSAGAMATLLLKLHALQAECAAEALEGIKKDFPELSNVC